MKSAIIKEHYEQFIYPNPQLYLNTIGTLGCNLHMGAVKSDALVVGCGTISALLIARDSPNHHIVGIDISSTTLEWSRQQAKKEKISNVELIEADITNWQYIGKKFPVVFASCVLHHIPKIDDALTNIKNMMGDIPPGWEHPVMYGHVYRKKHRGHILQTRRMLQALGIKTPEGVRTYISKLSEYHPSRIWYDRYDNSDIEVADTWLNPYAVHYTPDKWVNVLGRNGFTKVKWEPILKPKNGLMGFWSW